MIIALVWKTRIRRWKNFDEWSL